jgi:hypothetical protein
MRSAVNGPGPRVNQAWVEFSRGCFVGGHIVKAPSSDRRRSSHPVQLCSHCSSLSARLGFHSSNGQENAYCKGYIVMGKKSEVNCKECVVRDILAGIYGQGFIVRHTLSRIYGQGHIVRDIIVRDHVNT